jgi:hypothetical protein
MLKRLRIITLLLCFALGLQAQTNRYPYKRVLTGLNQQWHNFQIPNAVFNKSQPSLADFRIYGFKGTDTVEAPYILEKNADQIIEKEIPIKIINQSNDIKTGSYYTFEADKETSINQIRLSFKDKNFDWRIQLEGSNDQNKWFKILSDYRILSIKNSSTDYQFTQLNFPDSKYKFFRILINKMQVSTLVAAKVLKSDTLKGVDKPIIFQSYNLINDAENKESIVKVNLTDVTPISFLKLNIKDDLDFYRPIKIEYATDSFSTDKGTQYNYALLYEGTISSLEMKQFRFASTLTNQLKITIQNNDNNPLRLTSVELRGPIYELVARFEKLDYSYALYYGNAKIDAPVYDLKNFENKIPISLLPLTIGDEQNNPAFVIKKEKPLFENKAWLWALMGVIISILGYFSYKMLKN